MLLCDKEMLSYCFRIITVTGIFTNSLCAPLQTTQCAPCRINSDAQNQVERPNQTGDSANRRNGGASGGVSSAALADAVSGSERPRRRCCPYAFDSSICRVVNDRLLCGYNRNVGRPENNDEDVRLTGGCRIRGGRLECGYEEGPFNNIRRPPAWNNPSNPDPETFDPENDDYNDGDVENEDDKNNYTQLDTLKLVKKKQKLSRQKLAVTKCVEIKDRIVCNT